MKPVENRFWEKVDVRSPDECWNWKGSKLRDGYGNLRIKKHTTQAHRLSYELHFGKIPDGLFVLHKCDNSSCVNPNHLYLGDHTKNMKDKIARNRCAKGERAKSKLTEEKVIEIRKLLNNKVPRKAIGKLFGVGLTCITDIYSGRTWGWLKE